MLRRLALSAAVLAAAALLAAAPRALAAGSQTSTLTVTAKVLGACTVDSAAIPFGDYDPNSGTDLDASGVDIVVHCTNGTTYSVDLGLGSNSPGPGVRRMSGGAAGSTDYLTYVLFSDSGHTTAWANGVSRTANTAGPGLADYKVTVWGRIPRGQMASTGNYSDSVVLTVNF